MKRFIISILSVSFLIVFFYMFSFFSKNEEKIYLQNIRAAVLYQGKLDGPDKSKLRDVMMTMNPTTGQFNPKEIGKIIGQNYRRRKAEGDRDFQWEGVPSDIAGRVRTLMIDPKDRNKLWAGAVTGGLWYTNDFRNNTVWQPVSDNWENMSISCMTYNPQDLDVFYVGTGESYTSVNIYRESTSAGAGIYTSEDGGQSWSLLSSTTAFDYVNDIVVKVEEGISVIYVAVASGRYQGKVFNSVPTDGLYRSVDGGSSWTQVLPNIPGQDVPYAVADIELTANGRLFVGTMRNLALEGGGYILYSDDGLTWERKDVYLEEALAQSGHMAKPGRVLLKSAPSAGNIVYAMGTAGYNNSANQIRDEVSLTRILRTGDGGENWRFIDPPSDSRWSNIPWHALALGVDANNPNKIVIGGLDVYALPDATQGGGLNWRKLTNWFSMFYFSDFFINYYKLTNVDSLRNHFVHADVHSIQFISGSSDEVLFSTDGGVQFTTEMSKSDDNLLENRLLEYPSFSSISNSLTTTQYYTVALHPENGKDETMGGLQDNGTNQSLPMEKISYDDLIGGGDGAYCFFDADDPALRITSVYENNYTFIVDGQGFFRNFGESTGTFINPAVYDDRSNLLYANMAVDGGFELLTPRLTGRYLDTLGVINVNEVLGKNMLGLETIFYIKLGANSTSAFSALTISPHDPPTDATMVLGNQLGDIYLVTGLPYSPNTIKIDNDQLPIGYVSAVDIGASKNDILVTLSNYGTKSVWYTNNGGSQWDNLDRNLPDIPVRDGLFNPLDDNKVIIATEMGIWGLENIRDESEQWKCYDKGMPNVRVDMIKVRASDSAIVAGTHGRGIFMGKFMQGGDVLEPTLAVVERKPIKVYPNPVRDRLHIKSDKKITSVRIIDLFGRQVINQEFNGTSVNVERLNAGLYIIDITDVRGNHQRSKIHIN